MTTFMQLFYFWPLPLFVETRSSNACNMSNSGSYYILKLKFVFLIWIMFVLWVLNTCIYFKQGDHSNIKATPTSSGSDFCFDATWKSDSSFVIKSFFWICLDPNRVKFMKNLLQIIKAHIFLRFKFANKSKNYQDYYMQINLQKCLLQNKETCWWLERFFQILDWSSIYFCLLLSGQEGCVSEQQTFSLPILFESLSHGCSSLRWVCHYWWPPCVFDPRRNFFVNVLHNLWSILENLPMDFIHQQAREGYFVFQLLGSILSQLLLDI